MPRIVLGTGFASLAATVETPSVTTRLLPDFPNPFNPSTTIAFDLSEAANAVTSSACFFRLTVDGVASPRRMTLLK